MEEIFTSFGLVTAGVSLAMGTISLLVSLKRSDKTDFLFCLMGISLTVFFILPPKAFILQDSAPYEASLLIKRFFIYLYYAITPWFIVSFTKYPRKTFAYISTAVVVLSYIAMLIENTDSAKPIWTFIAVFGFGTILFQGVIAAAWQRRAGQKRSSRWLMTAMAFYAVLFILSVINQFDSGFLSTFNMKLLYPMHFHVMFFVLIMGLRLADALVEKYRIENSQRLSELRWRSFMVNAPVIVLELDANGQIIYINDFGAKLLGYHDPQELKALNWFDTFVMPNDMHNMKSLHKQALQEKLYLPTFKNAIKNKKGQELLISWVNFTAQSTGGKIERVMGIGTDVTSEESANHMVNKLQQELEKEKIHFNDANLLPEVDIIGNSKALRYALIKAHQVAITLTPVLLEGETGVGKELFANLVHRNSSRNTREFIKVNCGALPKELIEDELFGHEKGAFTSAIQARKGRFELADGGTIFLDEIGELPLEMQPKLLRVLQSGEFERIGGQKTIKVDVRIIAATNRNLANEVQHGRFRADLYYRLNVFPITIPSLRQRKDDLPELINYYIVRKSQKHGKKLEEVSKANLQRLLNYSWPGNIRELRNVIERSVIMSEGKTLMLDWWPSEEEAPPDSNNQTLEQIEKEHILSVMERCHWKINGDNGAAEVLDMHPNTLRSRMKKLGIQRPPSKDRSSIAGGLVFDSE